MNRRYRISVRFIKRDWGSGRPTWRRVNTHEHYRDAVLQTTRRLRNIDAKRAWFNGSSIKAY